MKHCGSFGLCGYSADCADHNCPGKAIAEARLRGFLMADDGRRDEPLTTPAQMSERTRAVLWSAAAFAIACLVAVACFGVVLQIPG